MFKRIPDVDLTEEELQRKTKYTKRITILLVLLNAMLLAYIAYEIIKIITHS